MQIPDLKNIRTHHAAVKQGSKIKIKGNGVPKFKSFPAYHIGGHSNKKKAEKSPYRRDKNGHPVGLGYPRGIPENKTIGLQSKFLGQEAVTVKPDSLI
jgi:hypothetical protein